MIEAFYTDEFVLPLPSHHRFPMEKYRILRNKVAQRLETVRLAVPPAATVGQLALAHCPNYIQKVESGQLSPQEQRDIGFPWSPLMVERSLRSVGASVAGVRSALQHGASVNLAGGTHHAKHRAGGGFCVFNDLAVAARVFQTDRVSGSNRQGECKAVGSSARVLVVDLDVHQGDGTAEILENDPSIFTFSMHGEHNYPFQKKTSDLDIALPNGTSDDVYLDTLSFALIDIEQRFKPDLLLYVAGLDAHAADRLGKLSLTDSGIKQRDEIVLDWAAKFSLPVVAVMAGGYFPDLDHLTDLQVGVVNRLANYGDRLEKTNYLESTRI